MNSVRLSVDCLFFCFIKKNINCFSTFFVVVKLAFIFRLASCLFVFSVKLAFFIIASLLFFSLNL